MQRPLDLEVASGDGQEYPPLSLSVIAEKLERKRFLPLVPSFVRYGALELSRGCGNRRSPFSFDCNVNVKFAGWKRRGRAGR